MVLPTVKHSVSSEDGQDGLNLFHGINICISALLSNWAAILEAYVDPEIFRQEEKVREPLQLIKNEKALKKKKLYLMFSPSGAIVQKEFIYSYKREIITSGVFLIRLSKIYITALIQIEK